ncbi:DsbA family protein [Rhodoferax antarcticus]|uniref:DsbA family protein n=1 Tax=Rhodoferax antarcticus TaxID=81479 RepID=UPI002224B4E5|nr:hypothetical protein [Rhodoferax antarcticus]MCW2312275.1 hypothetical protein [Rhodoferax antarcticus]
MKQQLVEVFGEHLRFVFRHFPLVEVRPNAEMADRIYKQRVQEHRSAGQLSGVRSAPSFFLNGTPVDVSFGFEKLDEAIRVALDTTPHVDTASP